ncbi:MAG: hypothetical protein Q8O42_07475 [Acidobacteriota bacterium]|nr:hypothetical protein [Acidobacteriota bacterium]
MTKQSTRPELHEHLASNRKFVAQLVGKGRHPRRIYQDFRQKRRHVLRDEEVVIELIRALAEFAVLGNAGFEPPATPELRERAAIAVCHLAVYAQSLPAHLWRMTRNQSTTCAICNCDCEYRAHMCDACKAATKAA